MNKSSTTFTHPIAITLNKFQTDILQEWVRVVKKEIKAAKRLQSPIIINTIPVFLTKLAEAIDGNFSIDNASDSNNIAEEHGGERARVTDYSPDQVVQEYVLLREVTLQFLRERHEIDQHVFSVIQKSFDEGIQKAMMAFHLIFNEIRENVVAHMTHDMRTPLTAAKLSLDIILKRLEKPQSEETIEGIKNIVHRIKKNINYSDELIQVILDEKYIKSYTQNTGDRFQEAELFSIVESALEGLSEVISKQINVSGERVNGFWDKKALRRVVENLISNALKYGFEDTPVDVKVFSVLGRAMVSVHNKGNPIPVEDRELLFNNFKRTEAAISGNKEGWGLGLALCREVTEDHAGSLGIESSLEDGTTFTIDIPVDPRGIKIKELA
ncbi:MAG: sensor histidine kinase [Rhizobacter sp.]|nr:sensor histidine kinase [Bacteriovorax sp.]